MFLFKNQWDATNQTPTNSWFNQGARHPNQQYGYNQQPQQQQAQYWPQNYNQQVTQQMSNENTNQFRQQSGYGYQNVGHQQTASLHQPVFNRSAEQTGDTETWNWGWGDEDNSNVQSQQNSNANINTGSAIADSFSNDTAWNWSVDDTSVAGQVSYQQQVMNTGSENVQNEQSFSSVENKIPQNAATKLEPLENVHANQHMKNVVLDHLTATGKRSKIENLTPQWSVESQMSQDSSDDILHTSESDKSHMLSRSSTISQSPTSAHDANADVTVKQERFSPLEYSEYDNQGQQENREILTNRDMQEFKMKPFAKSSTPTPPLAKQFVTAVKSEAAAAPPKLQTPPPQTYSDDLKNPYKHSSNLTHKAANRFRTTNSSPDTRNTYQSQSNFQAVYSQSVNLETLPDNSEQPDFLQPSQNMRKMSLSKSSPQWQENVEIAPMNDRNQYLETGHLSDADLHDFYQTNGTQQLQEPADALPPPGLRRMVLGQMEQRESNSNNQADGDNFGDEPPPGLSRMVLGQTENTPSNDIPFQIETSEPPAGLHRMVPGESSSPETIRQQGYQLHVTSSYAESEAELTQLTSHLSPQPRSATIGADTPPNPSSNRSETIGSDTPVPLENNQDTNRNISSNENRAGADGLDSQTGGDGTDNNRRESIEGQQEEMSSLVNSVRNLTVGENPTDGATSTATNKSDSIRRHSRQESSDSERDLRNPSPRSSRDRRQQEKDERSKAKSREKYSPDSYRDKRHERRKYKDRRYDDDTDYYSDKERERKNREEYEKKYSSLRKDKEKDRRRRENRDYGRDGRRGDYYYNRYEDYENDTR